MIKMQFKINDVNVTVKRHETVFKNDNRLMEKYIFEKDGQTFSTIVERLDASMREVAKTLLKQNINLI